MAAVVIERNRHGLATTGAGHRGGCFCGTSEAGRREIGRVRKARGVAHDNADTRTSLTTRRQLFDSTLVQCGRRRGAVLNENFREIATASHRRSEDSFDDAAL